MPSPLTKASFFYADPEQAALGRLLFYDKILSGNNNISCGTCHHHDFGSSDGLSLGIGEGGIGTGTSRSAGQGKTRIKKRIPRNASGLWNLGAKEIHTLLHDGRISISNIYGNGFNTPAEEMLPSGLNNILAVQALFPLTRQFEMAGNFGENEIIGLASKVGKDRPRIDAVWPVIESRIRSVPEYTNLFIESFQDIDRPSDIKINHIANAISAFIILEWTSFDSPFDDYLNGASHALTPTQEKGMTLFFGKASCSSCHSGSLFTDQKFYSLAIPQFGPGRTRMFDPSTRDVGRMVESDRLEDMYSFKTPTLRNVTLTPPYGHNGAYPTLEGIVRHHVNPLEMLKKWNPEMARLPRAEWLDDIDFVIFSDEREQERQKARIDIEPTNLTENEIEAIVSFLSTLTGKTKNKRPLGRPNAVPSGLPVD
ncbi:MAG: cytochrome c peroxidase [Pseudomonadota bacterium]|nr:cytochrome c peroxidase [Pseudomonadota bacterium]